MRYRDQNWPQLKPLRKAGKLRRRISVLPTLCTLGNLLCGFAAVTYIAQSQPIKSPLGNQFAIAGYLVFAAMVFDMLDGSMARLTKATSDFGAELDSLADMVSFGVAPAFLAVTVIHALLAARSSQGIEPLGPLADNLLARTLWILGAIYVACTALRLARFNAHNRHALDAHMVFRGLPSPGAAGVTAASVIFYETIQQSAPHLLPFNLSPGFVQATTTAFPYAMAAVLAAAALLMVSRISYGHVINQYLRGRRPFSYVVQVVVLLLLALWQPQLTALLAIYFYAFMPPLRAAWRRFVRGQTGPQPMTPAPAEPRESIINS